MIEIWQPKYKTNSVLIADGYQIIDGYQIMDGERRSE